MPSSLVGTLHPSCTVFRCNPLSKFTRKSRRDVLRPHFQRIGRDSGDKNRRKLRIFWGVRGSPASSSPSSAAAVWKNVLRVSYANVMPRYLSTPCLVHTAGRVQQNQSQQTPRLYVVKSSFSQLQCNAVSVFEHKSRTLAILLKAHNLYGVATFNMLSM